MTRTWRVLNMEENLFSDGVCRHAADISSPPEGRDGVAPLPEHLLLGSVIEKCRLDSTMVLVTAPEKGTPDVSSFPRTDQYRSMVSVQRFTFRRRLR